MIKLLQIKRKSQIGVIFMVLCALFMASCSISAGGSAISSASLTGPGAKPLPWLHVVVPTNGVPYLADPNNRRVILRGAAAVGLQDLSATPGGPALFPINPSAYQGSCPPASVYSPQPPLCEKQANISEYSQSVSPGSGNDFAQMRELGFNLVRLVLNWSQIEPSPGKYSDQYLARVSQVVSWAAQQGIYIILDMHQDQYSRYILPVAKNKAPSGCQPSGGSDGAPKWAIFTYGKPACAMFGQSALNPASSAAFYAFWNNHEVPGKKGESPGTGLQDHYIGALAFLANKFSDNSTVVGYELMNEPQPGTLSNPPLMNLYQSSTQQLYPFYRKAIEALTGVTDGMKECPKADPWQSRCAYPKLANVTRQSIFFEPIAYRNLIDFSPQISRPFSSYSNLVYAPHIYTHAFTADGFIGYTPQNSPYPPSYTFGYQTAESDAINMHAAVIVTEYGAGVNYDNSILAGETAAQDEMSTGSTVWAWKGISSDENNCWCVRWQYSAFSSSNPKAKVSNEDVLIPTRLKYLSRVYPRYIHGNLQAYGYDPNTGDFALLARSMSVSVGTDNDTIVYVPPTDSDKIAVGGSATLAKVVTNPDGSRLAYVSAKIGNYVVMVGNVLNDGWLNTVTQEAQNLPQPISEVQARQTLNQALQFALNSTDPSIKIKAGLANGLANLLLGSVSADPNLTHSG